MLTDDARVVQQHVHGLVAQLELQDGDGGAVVHVQLI